PETGLLGKFFEAVRPVDRTLPTHAPEQLVRRAVQPQLPGRQPNAVELAFNGAHRGPPGVGSSRGCSPDDTGWLASSARFDRTRRASETWSGGRAASSARSALRINREAD